MRLVDADAVVYKVKSCITIPADNEWDSGYNTAMAEAKQYIQNAQTLDYAPVVHGRWVPHGDDMWLCSNCKENIIFSMHESDRTEKQRYCCRCGAKMDGKDGEQDATD